jgi:two-component system, NtrC family, C4-dicarboxylate transport response regulator DctD
VQAGPVAEADSLGLQLDGFEKQLIIQALMQHLGSVTLAAEQLKLPRKTLYDKVARHGIDPARYRAPAPDGNPAQVCGMPAKTP